MRRAATAALALAAGAACAGSPSAPGEVPLTGTWTGAVPRGFYSDHMRLELVQNGSALSGQGVRGRACPADGTCFADVTVMGTRAGDQVLLQFGPPFADRFEGSVEGSGSLVGRLTGYSDRPLLRLARTAE